MTRRNSVGSKLSAVLVAAALYGAAGAPATAAQIGYTGTLSNCM